METTLKIYGPIGEPDPFMEMFGMHDDSISSKMVSDFLDANPDATEIKVRINSPGGDVQEGWNIYDLLTNSGKKITTVGEGKIYSIATVIFLAGSDRQIMKNADGLIHNPWIPGTHGADSAGLLKIAEQLAQEEEKILNLYVEKTGQDRDKLANYMKEETKLSSEDMLSLGFATSILEPVRAFAYYKPKINTMDETFLNKITAAIDAAVSKISGFSRLPVNNLELTDVDGKTFKIEKEAGDPAVGDVASPDGTYTMPDGKIITISGGVITEIMEPESELDKANKEIETLKAELETLKTSASSNDAIKAKLEADTVAASALVEELRALKNAWVPEGRQTSKGSVDGVDIARVQEITKSLKNK